MMNYMSRYWKRLAGSALCELVELFGDKISWPELEPEPEPEPDSIHVHYYRDRVFNQWRTFWMFLGQVLSVSQTCCEALRKAQGWLWHKEKKNFIKHRCFL
jgi:hypothetical protein